MIKIRQLSEADLDAVVALHEARFPGSRLTNMGRPFLKKMYRWFLEENPELSLVATSGDKVVGFAVGSVGSDYPIRVLRYALPQAILGALRRPQILFRRTTFFRLPMYLRGLANGVAGSRADSHSTGGTVHVELASLATDKAASGAGLVLVRRFEATAKRKGASQISGAVRCENVALRMMYQRLGWREVGAIGDESIYYWKDL